MPIRAMSVHRARNSRVRFGSIRNNGTAVAVLVRMRMASSAAMIATGSVMGMTAPAMLGPMPASVARPSSLESVESMSRTETLVSAVNKMNATGSPNHAVSGAGRQTA